jgi:hypothetical protein
MHKHRSKFTVEITANSIVKKAHSGLKHMYRKASLYHQKHDFFQWLLSNVISVDYSCSSRYAGVSFTIIQK